MNRLIAAFALLIGVAGLASAEEDTARATFGGSEFLAGGHVELSGRVSRNAFVSGGEVLVDGTIGRNLYAAGGTLKVSPEARIGEDAMLAGGSIVMDGSVARDLHAYGERIVVNGSVDGDVEFAGENLRLGPDARIGGKIVYRSRDEIVVAPGAQVAGGISKSTRNRDWRRFAEGASIVGSITLSLGMVLLGAVLVLGMTRFSREAGAAILQKPWQVLGLGCVMLIGVPVVLAVLLVTIVGIPLALLLAFAYGAILMLGYLIGAIFVGDFVLGRIDKTKLESVWWRALFMLLAIVVIAIVRQVPVAGPLAWWVLFLAGIGAFTLRSWQGFRDDPALSGRI